MKYYIANAHSLSGDGIFSCQIIMVKERMTHIYFAQKNFYKANLIKEYTT